MSIIVTAESGTIIVEGPAEVEYVEGSCELLGCEFVGAIRIPEYKALPIIPNGKCVIKVKGGTVRHLDERTIPEEWSRLELEGITMLVGEVDSGKTTLATYLLNKHVMKGLHVCVIDADIGQSTIGPPGVIGAVCTSLPTYSLSDLHMLSGYFIGSTTPSNCIGRFVGGLARVLRDVISRMPGLVIIDMPGWVTDGGLELMRNVIDAIGVDYVVAVGLGFRKWFEARVIEVPKARFVRARSQVERRAIRHAIMAKYLSNLKEVEVSLDKIMGNTAIECVISGCGRYIVDSSVTQVIRRENVVRIPAYYLTNIFAGLIRRGFLVGFGIVKEIDLKSGIAKVLVNNENFDEVMIGRMRIDPDTLEELEPIPVG